MRILFTSTCNGHESTDPVASLVDVYNTDERVMKALESSQVAVGRMGGSWQEIVKDGNIPHELIKKGKFSELSKLNYDLHYKLITGNY